MARTEEADAKNPGPSAETLLYTIYAARVLRHEWANQCARLPTVEKTLSPRTEDLVTGWRVKSKESRAGAEGEFCVRLESASVSTGATDNRFAPSISRPAG